MKKLFILSLTIVILYGCKKNDESLSTPKVESATDKTLSIYGKWLLVDAYMYVDNTVTGEKIKYSHFTTNKTISELNINGATRDIEIIEKNKTTWNFVAPRTIPGYGDFTLNSDTAERYDFYVTPSNWTIVEDYNSTFTQMNLNGSAIPVKAYLYDYDNKLCKFYVIEQYTTINGYNCYSFNELIFKKLN